MGLLTKKFTEALFDREEQRDVVKAKTHWMESFPRPPQHFDFLWFQLEFVEESVGDLCTQREILTENKTFLVPFWVTKQNNWLKMKKSTLPHQLTFLPAV